jgi:hypothetical protein
VPCKDSSSRVVIKLDFDERLLTFDFSKITCSKEVGGGTGYLEYCSGRLAQDILTDDFNELVQILGLEDTEDQFFLYLEWDALRTAIIQYLGSDEEVDRERYQLASITHEMDHIEITQVIHPDHNMPKLVSCFKRSSLPQNQSG